MLLGTGDGVAVVGPWYPIFAAVAAEREVRTQIAVETIMFEYIVF